MKDLKQYIAERCYEWDDICDNVEKYLQSIKGKSMKLEDINKALEELYVEPVEFDKEENKLYTGWNCNNNAEGEDTLLTVILKAPASENHIVVDDWEVE